MSMDRINGQDDYTAGGRRMFIAVAMRPMTILAATSGSGTKPRGDARGCQKDVTLPAGRRRSVNESLRHLAGGVVWVRPAL